MAKEEEVLTVVYLRKFPVDLQRRVKAAAALKGVTMKDFIVQALEEYLRKGAK